MKPWTGEKAKWLTYQACQLEFCPWNTHDGASISPSKRYPLSSICTHTINKELIHFLSLSGQGLARMPMFSTMRSNLDWAWPNPSFFLQALHKTNKQTKPHPLQAWQWEMMARTWTVCVKWGDMSEPLIRGGYQENNVTPIECIKYLLECSPNIWLIRLKTLFESQEECV